MFEDIPTDIQMRYIKHPFFCPFCESTQIATVSNVEAEMDIASQVIMCTDCNNYWVDVYELTAIEPFQHDLSADPF